MTIATRGSKLLSHAVLSAMRNLVIGLVLGMLGAILWLLASFFAGFGEVVSGESPPDKVGLAIAGFVVMFGGPLVFWIILPIIKWPRE